jgi:hypothetical protein
MMKDTGIYNASQMNHLFKKTLPVGIMLTKFDTFRHAITQLGRELLLPPLDLRCIREVDLHVCNVVSS